MSADWQTYRLGDFIPFTPEVYFRLMERANAAFWPWQLATVALGLAALVLALRGNHRSALIALAPAWVISALAFHFEFYAEINVAAPWFGWAFIAQAALLAIVAGWPGAGRLQSPRSRPGPIRKTVGTGIAALGIVAWPLLALVMGHGWSRSEVFGLHPDPTAIATLGIALLAANGLRAVLAIALPVLWCIVATLTLMALLQPDHHGLG